MDSEKSQSMVPLSQTRPESLHGASQAEGETRSPPSRPREDEEFGHARDYLTLGVPIVTAVEDARQYPRSIKNLITDLVAACGLATPLGSNILLPVLAPASRDLGTTTTVINLSIAFYCLAVAFAPMWWTTTSEHQGSRNTYVVALFLFIVFNVVAAVSNPPAMFIAMRLLAGATSAPVQALGAATVADLWDLKERGHAMGTFLLGTMAGNAFGPIIGGALGSRWSWRSTQWFMAIYGGVIWLSVIFFLPETRARRRTAGESEPGTSPKHGAIAYVKEFLLKVLTTLFKPMKLIPLLRFPPILITVCYTSINFAAYYFIIIVIQATFSAPPYSYSVIIVGLMYLPNAAGNILAATVGGRWTDRTLVRAAATAGRFDEQHKPKPKPQDMLGLNIWVAGLLFPAAILVSGWTSDKQVVAAAPLVANFFFAFGNMMVQNITTVMLTEFVPGRAVAGVALSNLVRNTLGTIVCIITQPLIDAIGVGWLSTIVALICGASASCIWFLQRNASRWAKEMAEKIPQP